MHKQSSLPTGPIASRKEHAEPVIDRPLHAAQQAKHHGGSWWSCWLGWLDRYAGNPVGPAAYGRAAQGVQAALRRAGDLCIRNVTAA